jgi:hypothetical protein
MERAWNLIRSSSRRYGPYLCWKPSCRAGRCWRFLLYLYRQRSGSTPHGLTCLK